MQFTFGDHVVSPSDVSFVVNVLDMWTLLESGFSGMSKKDKDRIATEVGLPGANVKFSGFDENNESELVSIAHFLVDDMGRFSKFKGPRSQFPCTNPGQESADVEGIRTDTSHAGRYRT